MKSGVAKGGNALIRRENRNNKTVKPPMKIHGYTTEKVRWALSAWAGRNHSKIEFENHEKLSTKLIGARRPINGAVVKYQTLAGSAESANKKLRAALCHRLSRVKKKTITAPVAMAAIPR